MLIEKDGPRNSWWGCKGRKRERDSLLPTPVGSLLGLGSRRRGEVWVALVSLLLGSPFSPPSFHGKVHIANDYKSPPGRKRHVYTIITELHSKVFVVLVVCFKSQRLGRKYLEDQLKERSE